MRKKIIVLLGVLGYLIFFPLVNGFAEDSAVQIDELKIGSKFAYAAGDEGRYREDHYETDGYTGGLESLILSGGLLGASFDADLRFIYDYDYGIDLSLIKDNAYYMTFNGTQMRKYYDGSNEPWDPGPYGLDTVHADRKDSHMYADRLNTDFEVGFFLDNLPDISFGWNRWMRDGEESLLRGSDVAQSGLDTLRSIPAISHVQGISDTLFVKLSEQIGEKHNVSLKQEIERYRDSQIINFPRYNGGDLAQDRGFEDEPYFQESLTHFAYNSFLTPKVFLTSNVLHQDLKNKSLRNVYRYNLTGNSFNQFTNPDVDNHRKADIANIGLVWQDGLVKGLRWGFNTRLETTATRNEGEGLKSGTLRKSESEQNEQLYGESFSLSYNGIKKTNISLSLELEQRDLKWGENTDIGSYELVDYFGAPETDLIRDTDVQHNDAAVVFRVSNRPNSKSKIHAKYKRANKKRKYANTVDNLVNFYPGYLGSSDQDIDQFLLNYGLNLSEKWSTGIEYLFEYDEIGYARQEGQNGQEMTRNQVSSSLTGILSDKLTVTFLALIERFDLRTPAEGASDNPRFDEGPDAFDYIVERYIGSVMGNYRLNDKLTSNLSYQHREVTGTVANSLDEFTVGLNRYLSEDDSLDVNLAWFNFNEKGSGGYEGFDDYYGGSVEVIYNKKF